MDTILQRGTSAGLQSLHRGPTLRSPCPHRRKRSNSLTLRCSALGSSNQMLLQFHVQVFVEVGLVTKTRCGQSTHEQWLKCWRVSRAKAQVRSGDRDVAQRETWSLRALLGCSKLASSTHGTRDLIFVRGCVSVCVFGFSSCLSMEFYDAHTLFFISGARFHFESSAFFSAS